MLFSKDLNSKYQAQKQKIENILVLATKILFHNEQSQLFLLVSHHGICLFKAIIESCHSNLPSNASGLFFLG